jgi:hypothetical protein
MAHYWYSYPLEYLESIPKDRYIVVRFDELVKDVEQTVARIYNRFDFTIDSAFEDTLRQETANARKYKSQHRYSLEEMGLTQAKIRSEYQHIFKRFDFD